MTNVAIGLRGATTTLGIDAKSGRLHSATWRGCASGGIGGIENRLSDYRCAAGLIFPFARSVHADGKEVDQSGGIVREHCPIGGGERGVVPGTEMKRIYGSEEIAGQSPVVGECRSADMGPGAEYTCGIAMLSKSSGVCGSVQVAAAARFRVSQTVMRNSTVLNRFTRHIHIQATTPLLIVVLCLTQIVRISGSVVFGAGRGSSFVDRRTYLFGIRRSCATEQ